MENPLLMAIFNSYFDITRGYLDAAWQGLVYVVDSSDTRRLEESSRELKQLLAEEKLAGIPTLVPWLGGWGLGVGDCGWVGLVVGEGNINGNIKKYIWK